MIEKNPFIIVFKNCVSLRAGNKKKISKHQLKLDRWFVQLQNTNFTHLVFVWVPTILDPET